VKRPAQKPLRDAVRENRLFRVRALTSFVIITICFLVLASRFFYLQVINHEEFTTRSEANRVKLRALPPNRGLIYDRNGRLIADNQPAYRLELVAEQVKDIDDTLDRLADVVRLDEDDRSQFEQLRGARKSFQAVPVRLRLSEEEVARFAVNRHRYPGVELVAYQNRVYPLGPEMAHVLGYVGRLDARDLETVDPSRYAATTHIGKTGLERFYEDRLHGQVGHERVEINAEGRVLGQLERTYPQAGADLFLTIDSDLQRTAFEALGDYTGAVVALDPRTGEILAMLSKPGFDPNPFVNGVSTRVYQELISSPQRPLFNRALQGGYEPGSTLKPFIGLAGLELGVLSPDHTVFSKGYFQLPGQDHKYRDWKRQGHGMVDLKQAVAQSVNVYFYQLALDLGIDRIHSYLDQFGFGRPTGVDMLGEASGILPSREWKRETHDMPWFPGETVITGIGQGFTVATPLQLAQASALIAARGQTSRPHLLRATRESSGERLNHSSEALSVPMRDAANWETIIDAMTEVVHGLRGTARAIASDDPDLRIAGKTGTAQVYGIPQEDRDSDDDEEVPLHLRHHALFIAFAPVDSPRIAVAVVAEHGGGGSTVAAPVARQVIDAWLTQEAASR
jgi:penicillin-binding protein 2